MWMGMSNCRMSRYGSKTSLRSISVSSSASLVKNIRPAEEANGLQLPCYTTRRKSLSTMKTPATIIIMNSCCCLTRKRMRSWCSRPKRRTLG